jgi:hypothetical protein
LEGDAAGPLQACGIDGQERTMIAVRLVHLIEKHSEELTEELLRKFQTSPRTSDLRKVPVQELRNRSDEILRNLSDWLLSKSNTDVECRYREIGALRACQNEHIWNFLQREGFLRGPLEIFGEMELLRLLDQFFDRAICYCAEGYEKAKLATLTEISTSNRPISAASAS